MRIATIQMGGTIDKVYPQVPNAYGFIIADAQSPKLLDKWKGSNSFAHHSIAKKDSQDLTGEDLQMLLEYILSTDFDGYLITHGTDTMLETGRFLFHRMGNKEKRIVLSGSRLPASTVDSDAELNIGMSIGVLHSCHNGVYMVLDGAVTLVK